MSMLAGPKRRQKWTLNPRGKYWSEDSNKFGQKMLEKMGWTSGKGLGAKEQGIVEHIRVKVKNDQVGIGFNKNRDDQWTEHQDNFNSFLQNLQKEQAEESTEVIEESKVLSGKSLEEKSKLSTKRVHYKKFTRGKDVNKYSTKDLANIFGKKDLNEKPVEVKQEAEEELYDPVGTKDTTAGILTIKGGNIDDYFKNKFYTGEQNGCSQVKEDSECETEKHAGFGFSEKSKSKFYIKEEPTSEKEDSDSDSRKYAGFGFTKSSDAKKSKRQNNLNYVFDNPCLDLNILDENSVTKKSKLESLNAEHVEKKTPKKRKKEFVFENGGLDLEYPDRPTPKKRKSEFTYENEGLDLECPDNSIEVKDDNEFVYDNPGLNLECPDRPTPKKIKKIKFEPISNDENPGMDFECTKKVTPKKIRKEKKSEVLSNIYENAGLDLEFPDKPTPKKNKKEKGTGVSSGYENPGLDLELQNNATPIKSDKVESEPLTNGFDNPALDLNCSDIQTPTKSNFEVSRLNYSDIESPKKSNFEVSRKECGVENIALDLSDEDTKKKRVTFNDHIEYNTDTLKKKKKKLDKYEVVNEKLKKKNKVPEPAIFVNEALDVEVLNEEEIDNELNERKSKKSNRKKNRKISQLETIEEAPEEENEITIVSEKVSKEKNDIEIINEIKCTNSEDVQEIMNESSKKKRKKKKDKKHNTEEVNEAFEESVCAPDEKVDEIVTSEEPIEVVQKKKKKKKSAKVEVVEDVEVNINTVDLEKENICGKEDETISIDLKKRKKKKKSSDEDVVSLEEFLNEEVQELRPTQKKQKLEVELNENKEIVVEEKVEDTSTQNSFQKFKKSKQVMKALFLKHPTLIFNGSNINEIKGYGHRKDFCHHRIQVHNNSFIKNLKPLYKI